MRQPKRVAVTGAAGQIAYSLLFRIAAGEMLGFDQPVILQLLDIPEGLKMLEGVVMELEDCAYPLLQHISISSDPNIAFKDCDIAMLVGARPRSAGMERSDLLKANGEILYGIFGDANWGYKERLSDETLINLIEHYSTQNLSLARIPDDQMGNAYEYLIKKFADDSGHTAAEFYTNRSLVSLMTEILKPQPNESIYDPTCGTGGMLLECINYLKRNKKDSRTLSLYGQEKNVISSAIARMNTLLHGYADAKIKQADTLEEPLFLVDDQLQVFDVILANPPYSIKKWNQKGWSDDPYNRNIYGTPPKGRADYAFIQHIIKSLSKKGRTAILLPHGVLFRDAEEDIREKLVQDDKLETVIGLPKDMFYNSPMEACIMIFHNNKTAKRKDHVLFINAIKDFERIDMKNFVNESHIKKISDAYEKFETVKDFTYVAHTDEIKQNNNLLSIPLYVKTKIKDKGPTPKIAVKNWQQSKSNLFESLKSMTKEIGKE